MEGDKASTEGKEEKGKKGVKRGRPGAEEEEAPKKIKVRLFLYVSELMGSWRVSGTGCACVSSDCVVELDMK